MATFIVITGEKFAIEADDETEALAKFEASTENAEFIEVDTFVSKSDDSVWEEAISYVIDVIEQMQLDKAYWDEKTLEELKQRIV